MPRPTRPHQTYGSVNRRQRIGYRVVNRGGVNRLYTRIRPNRRPWLNRGTAANPGHPYDNPIFNRQPDLHFQDRGAYIMK